MATNEIVYVNGQDVNDLGLLVTSIGSWWGAQPVQRSVSAPFGVYGVVPGSTGSTQALAIDLGFAAESLTVAQRVTTMDAVHEQMDGLCEVRLGDADRVLYAVPEVGGEPRYTDAGWLYGDVAVPVRLVAYNPTKFDRYVQTVRFGSTATKVPLGNLPSGGKITIHGAATNPDITYRDGTGAAVETMEFTTTLGADDALEIDITPGQQDIVLIENGSRSSGLSLRDAGWFFELDPREGGAAYLEVTGGSGIIEYRRAWK